jgi:hypothetical protein
MVIPIQLINPQAVDQTDLTATAKGYFNYSAAPGNTASLSLFRHRLLVHWRHTVRHYSCSGHRPVT